MTAKVITLRVFDTGLYGIEASTFAGQTLPSKTGDLIYHEAILATSL